METIGQRLRFARERLGLTLEEAERTTRIRAQHLASLERDDFASLPSPVQARGFLKNYCDYLKLDTAQVLQDYSGALPPRRPNGGSPAALRSEVRVHRRGWLSTDLLVAAGIALGTLTLLVWGGGRVMASLRAAAMRVKSGSMLSDSLYAGNARTMRASAMGGRAGRAWASFAMRGSLPECDALR